MKELIFATHNAHKVIEVSQILGTTDISIKSLSDINFNSEIIEDGNSMEENASIKSKTIYNLYNTPVFGEDSGLEVFSLDMEPGIYTARYAGPDRNADANMDKVLLKLKDKTNRKARFRACISYIDKKGINHLFEGIINGSISETKRGNDGFGYDPIFIPEGYDKTFAELDDEIKNSISHRSRAMGKFLNFLETTNRNL